MNQTEIDRLQILLNDEFLIQIINKLFTQTVEEALPEVSVVENNEKLGEKYRAYLQAKEILANGFIKLLSYKDSKVGKEQLNRAR